MAVQPALPPAAVRPADIEVSEASPDSQFKKVAPTDETRRIIAEAKAAPNLDRFPAIMLRQELDYTVNADRTTSTTMLLRIYLARDEAADEWANFRFTSSAANEITRVTGARTILPDGSSFVLDPARAKSAVLNEGFGGKSFQVIHLPNALAGCVVEVAYQTTAQAGGDLPAFYQELELQRPIPVVETHVTLKLPRKHSFHYVLKNSDAAPRQSETEHSRVLGWQLANLPAYEALPLDPPKRDVTVWLGVSSLNSWEEFDAWFRRIARGSDATDAAIAQKAAELAAGKKTAPEKIKAAFEFVSSLRYVAIEFGINAFRPRTPATVLRNRYGDCKDKANLLVALLREMKLPAHFVLINRGSSTDPKFPGWQFNHAIAYVPPSREAGVKEPLWLDSTDTTTPFGTIAPGNLGRSARVYDWDRASFKHVTLPAGEITRIADTWIGEQGADGAWQGEAEQSWTGLADYEKRRITGSLGPAQRIFTFCQWLNEALPRGDFSGFEISNVSDLAAPMRLQARWKTGAPARLNPAMELGEFLAAPTRDRPLLINDGQPLEYRQTVRLKFSAPRRKDEPPPAFERQAAGARLSIHWRWHDDRTLERIAVCAIREPRVSPENYSLFRTAFREWSSRVAEALE